MINALQIIDHFYPVESPLKTLLLKHSMQVRDKALAILDNCQEETRVRIDRETVVIGALLHDIGIRECDAPSIECHGKQNYIAHGTIGAEMLRRYGSEQGVDLEAFARICERHTGSGLTALFKAVISGSGYYQITHRELLKVLPIQFWFGLSKNDKGIYEQGCTTGPLLEKFCKNSVYAEYENRGHFWVELDDVAPGSGRVFLEWLDKVLKEE